MATTYTLKVTYGDGTGHTYTDLSRKLAQELVSRQFNVQYDRPESIYVTTQRGVRIRMRADDMRTHIAAV